MPFTISHAAAALPLHKLTRTQLPLAALMIGSMSPDFAYFLPGDPDRLVTHNIAGLFWFCWPASLAAWLLFVRVLERPTLALLPQTWQSRITPSTRELNLKAFALASAAVILGAATHIVWDSFTHPISPVVDAFPALRAVAFDIGGMHIRWYALLQHSSSLLGMAALLIWAWRLVRRATPVTAVRPWHSPSISNKTRVGAVLLLFATSCALALARYEAYPDIGFNRRLFHLAIGGMTGWALAWCAIALSISWRTRAAR